jgi:chromosome segregation ATPase
MLTEDAPKQAKLPAAPTHLEGLRADLEKAKLATEAADALYQTALVNTNPDRAEFDRNRARASLAVVQISLDILRSRIEAEEQTSPRNDAILAHLKDELADVKIQRKIHQEELHRLTPPAGLGWCMLRLCGCCV